MNEVEKINDKFTKPSNEIYAMTKYFLYKNPNFEISKQTFSRLELRIIENKKIRNKLESLGVDSQKEFVKRRGKNAKKP